MLQFFIGLDIRLLPGRFSIEDHQKITVDRYARLLDLTNVYVMPVLQGYSPRSYDAHLDCYGELLTPGQWVGSGVSANAMAILTRSKTSS
jgi:hypothetical protein